MSEQDAIAASTQPVTTASLVMDLRALGLQPGQVVLIHSSLSAMGWVCGGAQAVLQALVTVLGPAGTLVMPTHSGDWSDPGLWNHPPVPKSWWETIRATMPAFDPDLTPTRSMGVIPETFRKFPGALRSRHPTLSFAALGPKAGEIVGEQVLEDGLGEQSPLAKLYDLDGVVLLLGVGYSNNTTLHLAERRALGDDQVKHITGSPITIDGTRCWVRYWQPLVESDDFEPVGEAFEQQDGTLRRRRVGQADARLMGARSLVDFAVPWFKQHRQI
ncbi:MAG: AAC(3) family N-acetyltransferase [Cyanobacteria bacterium P01_A01_bin.135]